MWEDLARYLNPMESAGPPPRFGGAAGGAGGGAAKAAGDSGNKVYSNTLEVGGAESEDVDSAKMKAVQQLLAYKRRQQPHQVAIVGEETPDGTPAIIATAAAAAAEQAAADAAAKKAAAEAADEGAPA